MKPISKPTTKLFFAMGALVSLLAGNLAQAAGSELANASASLSNLRFTVVDLDPTDGIAASALFNGRGVLASTGNVTNELPSIDFNTLGSLAPKTVALLAGTYSASSTGFSLVSTLSSADMPPALDFGFSQVSGESRAMTFGAVNDPTSLNPNFSDITTITLSAKTALIITGDATVQAHGKPEVWAGAELLFDTPPEAMTVSSSGGAYVSMSLGMPDFVLDANGNSMWSPNTSLARFDLLSRFDSQWDFESGPQSSPFLLSVGNPGSAAVDENFQLSLGVQTQAYVQTLDVPEVPGIPEPGTYALMGLGLMGIALARRRAQG